MNSRKTQRLYKLPFNPHAPGGYYWDSQIAQEMREWEKENPYPWYKKLWYWYLKSHVETFYPPNIWTSIVRWWKRRTRGFDDRELWGLDYPIAKFILPRLKAFRDLPPHGYPAELSPCWNKTDYPQCCEGIHKPDIGYDLWIQALDKMIYAFETVIIAQEDDAYDEFFMTNQKLYNEGMELFARFYRGLWD